MFAMFEDKGIPTGLVGDGFVCDRKSRLFAIASSGALGGSAPSRETHPRGPACPYEQNIVEVSNSYVPECYEPCADDRRVQNRPIHIASHLRPSAPHSPEAQSCCLCRHQQKNV